jgi:cell division septum initiation protein DivIVA
VYVAPRVDAEVLRQAATEVMSANQAVADIKLEATQFASQTQSEAERIVAQAQASAERVVASTQVEASQALLNQEKQLRQTFEARERIVATNPRTVKLSCRCRCSSRQSRPNCNGHGYFVSSD